MISRYLAGSWSIALPRGAFGIVAYVPRERGNLPVLRSAPFCAGDDVLVVVKAATAGEAMKFLRGVHSFGLGRIWCVTWADGLETRVGVVELGNYLLVGDTFQYCGRAARGWRAVGGR